jgi:hypothetical protein
MSGGSRIGIGIGIGIGIATEAARQAGAAVRHSAGAVGETVLMHRVSDRAERRARAQGEWVA